MSKRDWADEAASMIVEAHINTWGMIPHPDYIKDSIAASLRAVRNGSLGPPVTSAQRET